VLNENAGCCRYGYGDYLIFDAAVVRGLAYYTGIVWEAFDRKGELRAIMGGGRYDRLLELYGGEKCKIPCCGFGFGDCVIMELLKELELHPKCADAVDFVVGMWSPDDYGKAAKIANDLRALGHSVDLMPTHKKKVAAAFEHADRAGARRMVFVAPDELSKGCVRIKDMKMKDSKGEAVQVDCPLEALDTIDKLIEEASKL
jgi:histidyl-tRNA synthetase